MCELKSKKENKKVRIWLFLMKIGAMSGCHQRPDRSFFMGKYQFPVCARCTGILAGHVIGIILAFIQTCSWEIGILLSIPMILDGSTQYLHWRESNQILRFLTGISGGVGVVQILAYIFRKTIGGIL